MNRRSRFLPRVVLLLGPIVVGLVLSACGASSGQGGEVISVAGGYLHTCALTSVGGVKCWGANESGQLGNGTTTDSSTPVDVSGLMKGVVAIAAGGHHTCAVTHGGGVMCWGLNDGGQLGNGTDDNSTTPVDVRGLSSGVVAVAAGAGWSCALTSVGGVKCWGWNHYGQLGNGVIGSEENTPVDVSGLSSGIAAISANSLHACALTTRGQVKCWGSIAGYQLPSKATESDVPVNVSDLGRGTTAISAGGLHACAIISAAGVKCWGTNREGELGDGSRTDSYSPVEVAGLSRGVTVLAVGSTDDFLASHTCVVTTKGGVMCWGPNGDGQLGNASTTDSSKPVEVSGLTSGAIAVAVGGSHTCAITKSHQLKCWGDNSNGQLGNGSLTNSPTPMNVVGP